MVYITYLDSAGGGGVMGVTYAVQYLEVSLYAGERPIMRRYVMEVLHHPPPFLTVPAHGRTRWVLSAFKLLVKKSSLVLAIYAPVAVYSNI